MLSTLNIGNILVVIGLGCLALGFWLPYATASRVFRIESRGSEYAAAIRQVLTEDDFGSPAQRHSAGFAGRLADRANAKLGLTDPASSLYLRPHAPAPARQLHQPAIWLEGKHYLFMVVATPDFLAGVDGPLDKPGTHKDPAVQSEAEDRGAEDSRTDRDPPLEIYGWPKNKLQGAQSVFFYSTVAAPSFHRNLANRYIGSKSPPRPGAGFSENTAGDQIYVGHDDQRWQYLDTKNR